MKKAALGVATVALFTAALSSTGHAWFFKAKTHVDTSKHYDYSQHYSSGRDSNTNSLNRYNSHEVGGNLTNSVMGNYTPFIGFPGFPSLGLSRIDGNKNVINMGINADVGLGDRISTVHNIHNGAVNNRTDIQGSYNEKE